MLQYVHTTLCRNCVMLCCNCLQIDKDLALKVWKHNAEKEKHPSILQQRVIMNPNSELQ